MRLSFRYKCGQNQVSNKLKLFVNLGNMHNIQEKFRKLKYIIVAKLKERLKL